MGGWGGEVLAHKELRLIESILRERKERKEKKKKKIKGGR